VLHCMMVKTKEKDSDVPALYSSPSEHEEEIDHRVDALQALNTALCYLCSINADASEVERFLLAHPEALLLEGLCLLPEDSARYILQQHVQRCHCQGHCRLNRVRVLDLLDRGFAVYQSRREACRTPPEHWSAPFRELVQVEREIRRWRIQELTMRNVWLETSVEVRSYQEEWDRYERARDEMGPQRSSALAKLVCSRHHSLKEDSDNHRAVLEYQVHVAMTNVRSVEREHAQVLQNIREGRRRQFNILKRAFEGCLRHDICSMGIRVASSDVKTIRTTYSI
jgi:hypothetical protein